MQVAEQVCQAETALYVSVGKPGSELSSEIQSTKSQTERFSAGTYEHQKERNWFKVTSGTGGMLRGASSELPEPPVRPPPPDLLKVLHLRCSKPPDTAEVLLETCKSPNEDLSQASPAQAVTSDAPPSAVRRRSYNVTEKARSSLECSERPARPPPPDPLKIRAAAGVQSPTLRTFPSQSTETLVVDGHLESSHIKNTETDHVHNDAPTSLLTSDKRRLSNPFTRPHPPPLPTPRLLPAVVHPRQHFQSQTAVEDPVEHVYECIEDLVPEGKIDKHDRRPARPPLPENSKVQHLHNRRPPMLSQIGPMQCPTSPETEVVIHPSVKDQDIPEYIDVLPDLSSAQHVEMHNIKNTGTSEDVINKDAAVTDPKPNGPDENQVTTRTTPSSPPPVLPRPYPRAVQPRKPLLTQSALEEPSEDVCKYKRTTLLKNKETLEKSRSLPAALTRWELEAYRSWSWQCNVLKVSSRHSESPARPPPPDATKVRHLRPSKSVDPYVQPIKCPLPSEPKVQTNPPLQDQDIPEYIQILPDSSYSQGLSFKESPDNENTETFQNNSGAASTVLLYEDIVPDVCGLTNGATPVNIQPPVVQPRPAVVRPKRPFLSQSTEPVEHVYEHIEDVLTELPDDRGSRRSLPAALSQRGYSTYRSRSVQLSVYEDSTTKELDLLLDWWRRVGGKDMLPMDCQAEERNHIISTAQRLKTAMRLYELLIFQRCTLLLNYITDLHCTADGIIKTCKKARIGKMMGGTTGAVGGVAIAAGLALTPLTFGASAVAAGVGVGVVTVGGFTGASATLGKKMKGAQLRNKVEKIFENYNTQMEDITDCLKFIVKGLEHLRNQDHWTLMDLHVFLGKIVHAALESDKLNSIKDIIESHHMLRSWKACFQEDENSSTKKTSDSKFAEKVHEVADKLKEEVDDLSRIRKFFSSISDQS